MTRYAIWLAPNEKAAQTFGKIIGDNAGRHKSPTFAPHITLLTSTQFKKASVQTLTQAIKTLGPKVAPFSIHADEIHVGDTFHQSILLGLTEPKELTQLQSALKRSLNVSDKKGTNPSHFPHVSLYYGDGTKEDKHQLLAHMMDSRFLDVGDKGHLVVADVHDVPVNALWLVELVGEAHEWKILEKVPLTGKGIPAAAKALGVGDVVLEDPHIVRLALQRDREAAEKAAKAANGSAAAEAAPAPAASEAPVVASTETPKPEVKVDTAAKPADETKPVVASTSEENSATSPIANGNGTQKGEKVNRRRSIFGTLIDRTKSIRRQSTHQAEKSQ